MSLSPDRMPSAVEKALRTIESGDSGSFPETALRVFAHQFEHNPPYRRFCLRRSATPDTVTSWEEVPAVPTAAFKEAELTTAPARFVFETSGTTGGPEKHGRHLLPDLSLYEASWAPPFHRHVMPDRESMFTVSLIPSTHALPHSSLSFMADRVLERFGAPGSGTYLDHRGIDSEGLHHALDEAVARGEPVLILGTAFGLVNWLDTLGNAAFSLPPGSRLMDTGGFKGRSREVSRETLFSLYAKRLGIPASHTVGEYGMTELCSQFYETNLSSPGTPRRFEGPPWIRTRILDPVTLEAVPPGEPGLLAHFDLANAWSVSAVMTEDLGRRVESGFELLGRAGGAELRGCSLATEELLRG